MPSFHRANGHFRRPENVGILGLEVYFPPQFVCQRELEIYDGVSEGKYTIGLGQSKMGFCTDSEDINSLCLTVLSRLIEKTGVGYENIGYLGVGTETIIDKSKSIKSVLMQLFEECGNYDVEGTDSLNACYGGTNALFRGLDWIESSHWDGRYAVVVCGDIAVYAKGAARPTGGAGAVAMLLGENAPLTIEGGAKSSYFKHTYDFFKPDLSSEYPTVDGQLTIKCYLQALDNCYKGYFKKSKSNTYSLGKSMNVNYFDSMIFHAPFGKLVAKSFARLVFNDFLACPSKEVIDRFPGMEEFRDKTLEETYFDKQIFDAFMKFSKEKYLEMTEASMLLSREVGNMYTPSIYGGLASLLGSSTVSSLKGKRIGMFSYGSGLAATLFSIRVTPEDDSDLEKLISSCSDLKVRLSQRTKVAPKFFEEILTAKEAINHKAPFTPLSSPSTLFPGTWYLTHVDEMHRRKYQYKRGESLENGVAESCSRLTNGFSLEPCEVVSG